MPERFLVLRRRGDRPGGGKPVHLNMLGGEASSRPRRESVAEALRRNVAAISGAKGVISITTQLRVAMSAADLIGARARTSSRSTTAFHVNNAGAEVSPGPRRCGTAC